MARAGAGEYGTSRARVGQAPRIRRIHVRFGTKEVFDAISDGLSGSPLLSAKVLGAAVGVRRNVVPCFLLPWFLSNELVHA